MRLYPDAPAFLIPPAFGLFGHCHGSTLVVLPDGGLLAAFFAGQREGAGDTAIWLSRRTASGWQRPNRVFARDGVAHWNPVLHAEGSRVWLFYKTGPSAHDWIQQWAVSEDAGHHWTEPRPLAAGDPTLRGPVRNKLLVLSDGDWLAPGSVETDRYWDAFTDRSTDKGRTWHKATVPLDHHTTVGPDQTGIWQGLGENALWETRLDVVFRWDGVIQPSLWESTPGQVHMLLRSTRGQVYRSDSRDGGRHWAPAYATPLPNNNSALDLVRLTDGTLVLACNPVPGNWGRRYPLTLLVSPDNGATWHPERDLETAAGEFSYPAVVAAGDTLQVTYTWNRTNIMHRPFRIDMR